MSNIKSIRSLLCADHACNIPPTVVSITWNLGKRCNYDCSYCSPNIHDFVSPFIDLELCKTFVDKSSTQQHTEGKRIKWSFTGGEPFIDPGFMPLLEHISLKSNTEQINVVTNGSLPISLYAKALTYLSGLTVSLHLERSLEEINQTVGKIVDLHCQYPNRIMVNIMYLPGSIKTVDAIRVRLDQDSVPYVVRKITPQPQDHDLVPWKSRRSRKDVDMLDTQSQSLVKRQFRILFDQQRESNLKSYYNKEDLAYLVEDQTPVGQNMAIWQDDGSYQECNSNQLIAQDKNTFLGWQCYAGVDHVMIDFDGKIYVGNCQNNGPIGDMMSETIFQKKPTVCQQQWCTCATDIPIRKAIDETKWLQLIAPLEKR